MNFYRVIGRSAQFFSGTIKLSDRQSIPRAHLLKPVGEGIFEILSPIEFKAGEELSYDGEVNKAMLQNITPVVLKAEGPSSPEEPVPLAPPKAEDKPAKKSGSKKRK